MKILKKDSVMVVGMMLLTVVMLASWLRATALVVIYGDGQGVVEAHTNEARR